MIKDAVRQYYQQLCSIYTDREARYITDLVFEHITGFSRLDIITRSDTVLTMSQEKELSEKLLQLLDHKPIQYVLNKCVFYHLPFYVNEHVLIPRPETEELVEWIIENYRHKTGLPTKDNKTPLTILDAGTGSGCIAIALKKNISNSKVIAIDNSIKALAVAEQNAKNNDVAIEFKKTDLLSKNWFDGLPLLDVIVSNPPYIPWSEHTSMQRNVTAFEPSTALFVPDNDPLVFYRTLILCALQKLRPRGELFMEIHEHLGKAVMTLCDQMGLKHELRKDLSGRDRMVRAALLS